MPYYANAGEAFWNGANAGASMASKWVSAFKYGDEYRSNKDFEEQARNTMDTYNKGREEAKAITDVSQREARMQELLQARNDGLTKAGLNLGERGGKAVQQYISTLDAADQNVSNETYRRNQREIYAENPRKYTVPRMGFTANVPGIGNQLVGAYEAMNGPIGGGSSSWNETAAFGQDLMGGNEMAMKVGASFGLKRDANNALYFDLDGQSGYADMPGVMTGVGNVRGFAGAAYGY